ncbi:MAG: APC family permease [Mycoplasma sp.]
MAKVTNKTTKKIGLISAISMLIGSIVGIGIFFKNGSVFETNNGNGIAIMVAWVLSGLISVAAAFSFAEIGSSVESRAGIGGWCHRLVGKGFGRFVKIVQPIFYFGILSFSISIFAGEALFNIFNISGEIHFSIIMLVGFALFAAFLFFNYVSLRASAKASVIITGIKFVPLIMVIVAGFIYGVSNPDASLFQAKSMEEITSTTSGTFSFAGILVSIPSILFAFDPFFGAGNLSKDIVNPKKNVPLTVIISMITVTAFYLLITIAQIFSGQGNVYGLFDAIFADNEMAKNAFGILLSVFIFIAITGVLNSFSALIIRSYQSILDSQLIAGAQAISKFAHNKLPGKYNELKPGAFLAFSCYVIIFIIMFIPSAILNTDAFVDGISNFPITVFFGVYGVVILAGIFNRFTKRADVQKVKGFLFVAPLAVIGCFLVSGFQLFYTFTTATFMDPNGTDLMSWGLFSTNGVVIQNWVGSLIFFIYIGLMMSYYLVNNNITKKYLINYSLGAEVSHN